MKSNFINISNSLANEAYYPELINIVKKSSSIISQCFFGLILEKNNCNCKIKNVAILKYLDLDITSIFNHYEKLSDSMVMKDINDFLDFYFLKAKFCDCGNKPKFNNKEEFEYCPKCDKIINMPFTNI